MRLLLAVLFFQTTSANAAFNVANCEGINALDFSQVFLEKGVPCETALKIQRELQTIKAFAGSEPPLILFVNAKSYESYSTYGRLIVLNHQQMAWGQIRDESQNEKIWAHEIGHTLFSTWLAQDFKPIEGFRDYMTESDKLLALAKDLKIDTSKNIAGKWSSDFGIARDLQVPYTELFADLVGVLFANDPMAMRKAMIAPGMSAQAMNEANYYGFKGTYDLNKWTVREVHYFFAPARAYIGEKFLRFPLDDKKKQAILRKVYQACFHEIQKYWDASKKLPEPAEANRSLIATLSAK